MSADVLCPILLIKYVYGVQRLWPQFRFNGQYVEGFTRQENLEAAGRI